VGPYMPRHRIGRVCLFAPLIFGLMLTLLHPGAAHAQGDDDDPLDQDAAAQDILAALPSLTTYDTWVREEQQFQTFTERIDTPAGDVISRTYTIQLTVRDEVDTQPDTANRQLRRVVDRVMLQDGVEVGRQTGELRVIGLDIYFTATSSGTLASDTSDTANTQGWRQATADNPPPAFLQPDDIDNLFNDDPLRRDYGTIGLATLNNLTSTDDILSSIDEMRVQAGRFVDGGDVIFYRLLGDGLVDVVADTSPLDTTDPAIGVLVADGIRDVSLGLVVDDQNRLRSQIAAYNLAIQNADATLFTPQAGVYSLQASVNIVERYLAVNEAIAVTVPGG
jgi:hypothetical protein